MTYEADRTIVEINKATLAFDGRAVWRDLDLRLRAGEFLAVLGPNGSGKSSLLKVLLGIYSLQKGAARVNGRVGYVPQQRTFDIGLPIRGRDVVRFGLDGTKWGVLPAPDMAGQVEAAIEAVGAGAFADEPMGRLSGGQQQRLRIAQAVVGRPELLLCDEPLLSLDPASQKTVGELIDKQRANGSAVVFVTHEINPVLPYVDRILYLVNGRWELGKPHEVLTSKVLSVLYGVPVEVLNVRGHIILLAGDESAPTELAAGHHHSQAPEANNG